MNSNRIRIGTRGSALALAQSRQVMARLKKMFPAHRFELAIIKTTGDKLTRAPLSKIGQKGLFIKEIETALIRRKIDLAVHSLKDVPTDLPAGLELGALLKREEPNDCLVSLRKTDLTRLSRGSRIGTSSLRRQAQILKLRPDLRVENLRGNLDTRLRKLKEGLYDAIVVARAGLNRLKNSPSITARRGIHLRNIPFDQMVPAVGQGIVALEVRSSDKKIMGMVQRLNDPAARACSDAERAFMAAIQGGCQVPAGAIAAAKHNKLSLTGMIASLSGDKIVKAAVSGPVSSAQNLGKMLGAKLLSSGGKEILENIRN